MGQGTIYYMLPREYDAGPTVTFLATDRHHPVTDTY